MSTVQPPVNLSPTAATLITPRLLRSGALKVESTKASQRVWFYLPSRFHSMINKIVDAPGSEFGGGGHPAFYLMATVRLLQEYAPFNRDDPEYGETLRALESLSRTLRLTEPMARFSVYLEEIEDLSAAYLASRSWDSGLSIMESVIAAVREAPAPMLHAWEIKVRGSLPLKALTKAIGKDPDWGLSDAVNRVENWMGGAL